jgi:hypothetical protein
MQSYIEQIDCERPTYTEVVKKQVDRKFNNAYIDAPDLLKRMRDSRKKNADVVTIGLWPLDFVSYDDWRQTTHAKKKFPEYVTMARIEVTIVDGYRSKMLKKCPASAYIRINLASALADACKATAWQVQNADTGKMEKKTLRRFAYVDKIACKEPSTFPKVNVVDLKESRQRVANAESLATEAAALLKKVENFRGSSAIPGSKMIDKGVSDAITTLREVRCLDILFTLLSDNSRSTRPSSRISLVSVGWTTFYTRIPRPIWTLGILTWKSIIRNFRRSLSPAGRCGPDRRKAPIRVRWIVRMNASRWPRVQTNTNPFRPNLA